MRNKPIATILVLLMSIVVFIGSVSFAEDLKSRLKTRKPAIDLLKHQGIVGENNRGFLEFIGNDRTEERIVSAENADRRKIYQAIAKQQGVSTDLVGNLRAKKIEKIGKAGQSFQDSDGKWYKK